VAGQGYSGLSKMAEFNLRSQGYRTGTSDKGNLKLFLLEKDHTKGKLAN